MLSARPGGPAAWAGDERRHAVRRGMIDLSRRIVAAMPKAKASRRPHCTFKPHLLLPMHHAGDGREKQLVQMLQALVQLRDSSMILTHAPGVDCRAPSSISSPRRRHLRRQFLIAPLRVAPAAPATRQGALLPTGCSLRGTARLALRVAGEPSTCLWRPRGQRWER